MKPAPLRNSVEQVMKDYLTALNGEKPHGMYKLVVGEVEAALLKCVMEHVDHNQSHAADCLGINRGTLRKKLKDHGFI
ncbi:transcriptional regulator, Fis family protein [gamma proteobacterium HTCC5015]|nr:transcriptional regulator, Fis family protein [gamma proteobacterium HTCC5015]